MASRPQRDRPPLIRSTSCCEAARRQREGSPARRNRWPIPRRLLLEEEIPDDRPTQTSGTRYFTEVRLGDRAVFLCVEEAGGWLRGDAEWFTADFAGHGRLQLSFDERRTEIVAAPAVIEAVANTLAMNVTPELDDDVVHERAVALVRARFAGQPDFVWEVAREYCREGLLVRGRASSCGAGPLLRARPVGAVLHHAPDRRQRSDASSGVNEHELSTRFG